MDEQSIFLEALEKSNPAERAAWLEEACRGNDALKQHILGLLERHQEARSFLERPPVDDDAAVELNGADTQATEFFDVGQASALGRDPAAAVGSYGHSVLKMMGDTLDVPRVVLREAAQKGLEHIVRPSSPQMPKGNSDSRYQLQGEIARGGMGAILRGRDTDLGRELAIKVLLDEHKSKPEVIQRFIEEAQIGGQLQHPGIAPIYELGQFVDRRPFFSMKLVKGKTLSRMLADRNEPQADRGRFLGIFEQVCQTMAYAHSRGVIHRDLKPANIMVGAFGEVQVMDWGLAKVLSAGGVVDEKRAHDKLQGQSVIETLRSAGGSDAPGGFGSFGSQTQMGSVMGTPAYMPPEQALGEIDNLDERADVFGLGAILCEILTGMPPYVADDGTQIFRMASRGKLADCFQRLDRCGADAELIALTKRCLALEPVDRPRDAGVLAERVTEYLESAERKLRESELERAAQAARADAEAAQANAERQRADAESRRAEAESRRAEAEQQRAETESERLEQQRQSGRKLRKMLAGLAGVTVVAGVAFVAAMVATIHANKLATLASNNEAAAKESAKNAETERQTALRAQRETAAALQLVESQKAEVEKSLTKAEQAEREALAQGNRADRAAKLTRQNLYYAQMHLAQQAWREHRGLAHMHGLLANWLPSDEQPIRRDWEWFYINSLPYQNLRTLPKHNVPAEKCSVAWHASSNRLAEGAADGLIRIWDVDREQVERVIAGPKADFVFWGRTWFAWSPDGARLAAGGREGTVQVWEVASGTELVAAKTHDCSCVSVNFDSTGTFVAVCGVDGSIKLVDARTGESRAGATHPGQVTAVAWSRDGRQVAVGHDNGTVTDSEIQSGAEVSSLSAHANPIYCIAWSPDGRRFATSSQDEFYAQIWDRESRQPHSDQLHHSHAILSMAWSADGEKLATVSADQTVKIWTTDDGRESVTLRGFLDGVCSVAWGPGDRQLAASAFDGSVKIWTSLQEQESFVIPGKIRTTSVAWSPDGKRLAAGSDDGLIRIWDSAGSAPAETLQLPESRTQFIRQFGLMRMLAWSPDGTYLASAGTDGKLAVWNVDRREHVPLPPVDAGAAWCVAWSREGDKLAAGFEDGTVRIVAGMKQNPRSYAFKAHQKRAFTVAWSPKGDRLASGSIEDQAIRIWDSEQGTEIMALDNAGGVLGLAWSPDGRTLASAAGTTQPVKTWDAVTGRQIQSMHGHHDFVVGIVWSPDGSRLATAGFDNSVRVWDPATGAEACVLYGRNGFFHDVSWNADGARLAAACGDGTTWIWDATRGFERDATPQAITSIDRAVATRKPIGDDRRWFVESYLREGKPKAALSLVKEYPLEMSQLVRRLVEHSDIESTDEAFAAARGSLQQELTKNPSNREIADELAELLIVEATSHWKILKPTALKSAGGTTLTQHPNGSITSTGEIPSKDIFTIEAEVDPATITAFRLEAIPDPHLPQKQLGHAENGWFLLSEFGLSAQGASVPFSAVLASWTQPDWPAELAIDGNADSHWGTRNENGRSPFIMFFPRTPLIAEQREKLTFTMNFNYGGRHLLRRFRLWFTCEPDVLAREQRLVGLRPLDPWKKLAAVYHFSGNHPALDGLLREHPEAAEGLIDLYVLEKNWEAVIRACGPLITADSKDARLFVKRAEAYLATEKWELAETDWQRAVLLNPELLQAAFDRFQRAGRWQQALPFGQRIVDGNPQDALLWLRLAPVAALAGDETYRDFCRRCAQQFREATDPVTVERAIKSCLIRPDAVALDSLPVSILTKLLDENTAPDWLRIWAWNTRALLAFRSGDAASAVNYVAKTGELDRRWVLHGLNLGVLALAEHQRGNFEKSRAALNELSEFIATQPTNSNTVNHDVLIAKLLYQEADAKINSQPKPTAEATTEPPGK